MRKRTKLIKFWFGMQFPVKESELVSLLNLPVPMELLADSTVGYDSLDLGDFRLHLSKEINTKVD